jgi:hypothetical protein
MEIIKHDWEKERCPYTRRSRKFRLCLREHCPELEENMNGQYRCSLTVGAQVGRVLKGLGLVIEG